MWVYGGPAAVQEGIRLRRLHAPIKGVTADGRRTAQFEHTLLVTDTGVDVLTRPVG